MLKVGLTGGIAVGKSTVSQTLTGLGCYVLDADQVARLVVEPHKQGYEKIVAEFGLEVLASDGRLDRVKLGQIVFNDESQRKKLNQILHPIIIEEQEQLFAEFEAKSPNSIGIIDASLMIETGSYKRFEKIVVVHCSKEIQLSRLMARNQYSLQEAEARIASQMPNSEKLKYADFVIDTNGTIGETKKQTVKVFHSLKQLADSKPTM
ncbi:MAG: dephospho-CoA kinase [Blastocatellia bacterium]|nr:dephospho-CoA kinase [Blastocatellia bacterium]